MSKVSCDLIKDLLPLYIDEVCSAESKREIEEHLKECSECRALYESMKQDIVIEKVESKKDDSEQIKRLMSNVNLKIERRNSIVKAVCAAVCALIIVIGLILTLPLKNISEKDLTISCEEKYIDCDRYAKSYAYNDPVWSDKTLFIYPDDKNIDECIYVKGTVEGEEDFIFAVAEEYMRGESDRTISVVKISSDYNIKKYKEKYYKEQGLNLLDIKTVKTSILGNLSDTSKSVVTLYYFDGVDRVRINDGTIYCNKKVSKIPN